MTVSADQFNGSFGVEVKMRRCANGETAEFWLELGGIRVGKPVFKTPVVGDSLAAHAAGAFRRILAGLEEGK